MTDIQLRIIGIGSPFIGDHLGIEAVNSLSGCPGFEGFENEVEWCALDRPGAGLVEWLKGAEAVILIDAMHSGSRPGTVSRLVLSDLLQQGALASSHQLGVAESLALAHALGELPARLLIYGIESGENLMTQQWLPALKRLISEDVYVLLGHTPVQGAGGVK